MGVRGAWILVGVMYEREEAVDEIDLLWVEGFAGFEVEDTSSFDGGYLGRSHDLSFQGLDGEL